MFCSSRPERLPITEARVGAPSRSRSKDLGLCSVRFHLPFSVRFVCTYCPVPLKHSRLMGNNGRHPTRRIGSGSITTLMCIIRTIITLLNTIRADQTYIIGILRKCRFQPTISLGSIFIRRNGVTILVIIFGSIFFRGHEKRQNATLGRYFVSPKTIYK